MGSSRHRLPLACPAVRLALAPAIASPPRAAARIADAVPSRSTIARSGGCSSPRRVARCMGPWRTRSDARAGDRRCCIPSERHSQPRRVLVEHSTTLRARQRECCLRSKPAASAALIWSPRTAGTSPQQQPCSCSRVGDEAAAAWVARQANTPVGFGPEESFMAPALGGAGRREVVNISNQRAAAPTPGRRFTRATAVCPSGAVDAHARSLEDQGRGAGAPLFTQGAGRLEGQSSNRVEQS